MAEQTTDQPILHRITQLVAEEQQLRGHAAPSETDLERLAKLEVELDKCWDLLRQRRALREFGRDPAEAQVRPASVVEKYVG
jgi:Protein of unknown function (DUF2630)